MIKEICQFVETLEEQTSDLFEEGAKLKEGIYVALDIGLEDGKYVLKNVDENGNILKEDIGLFTKQEELNPFFERCRMILQASKPVSAAKIFNPNKKIFNVTCSPFAVGCTKKFLDKNFDEIGISGLRNELFNQYFKKARDFVSPINKTLFEGFVDFFHEKFRTLVLLNIGLSRHRSLFNKATLDYTSAVGLDRLKESYTITFFIKNLSIDDFKSSYEKYLGVNVFNKTDYNAIFNNITYGVSDSLSSFNDKKRFLQHQTASFRYNFRINGEDAQLVWKFYQLSQNKQLPNPLPIFVDKKEANLNAGVVKLFNNEGVAGYSEIIMSLLNLRNTNLQNFYLFFIQRGQIIDLDFVPLFRFKIDEKIFNLLNIPENPDYILNNVFDLENELNKVFTKNHRETGKGYGFLMGNYFTDKVESQKPFKQYNVQREILAAFYKYRFSIYEYIYKSKMNAITSLMFDDMMLLSIKADLSVDEFKDNYHTKDYSIKEKLNIWFSLYNFFEFNFNFKRINMKQNLKQHQEMMQKLVTGKYDINDDEEFAFVSGQIIYYILSKSVTADKSYSRLEPFLQKTDCSSYKQSIVRIFDMYKHEIFTTKFGKCMAQVMDFDTDRNLKEITPFMLAGFFSENFLFSDNNQQ